MYTLYTLTFDHMPFHTCCVCVCVVFSLCLWRSMWRGCWADCQGSWRPVTSSPPPHSRSTPGQPRPLTLVAASSTLFSLPLSHCSRQRASLALSRHTHLLEVLEIPQVTHHALCTLHSTLSHNVVLLHCIIL